MVQILMHRSLLSPSIEQSLAVAKVAECSSLSEEQKQRLREGGVILTRKEVWYGETYLWKIYFYEDEVYKAVFVTSQKDELYRIIKNPISTVLFDLNKDIKDSLVWEEALEEGLFIFLTEEQRQRLRDGGVIIMCEAELSDEICKCVIYRCENEVYQLARFEFRWKEILRR